MYEIEILKAADKSLRLIPSDYRTTIAQTIHDLSTNPRPTSCKKLKDSEFYRIRVGMYRIIYSIQDNALLVVIIRIAHRKEVYR